MTQTRRRSSRIPKEVGILLRGTDMEKKAFSEHTKTVVINRNGAGIVSRYRLAPESKINLRRLATHTHTEVRVVGLVESQSGVYIYGVAFLDPDINFWGMDFPPDTESEQKASHKLFECSRCKTYERINLDEMQSDIYAVHHALARSCKRCGSPTVWKRVGDPDSDPTSSARASLSPLANLP
jgi:hypothetical protein